MFPRDKLVAIRFGCEIFAGIVEVERPPWAKSSAIKLLSWIEFCVKDCREQLDSLTGDIWDISWRLLLMELRVFLMASCCEGEGGKQ